MLNTNTKRIDVFFIINIEIKQTTNKGMSILINVLGTILGQVAKRNNDNNKVKTADPVVFEDVQKKMENVETRGEAGRTRADVFKDYLEKVEEAKVENEANPEVETADKSVYDDLVQEIERLKVKIESQGGVPEIELPNAENPQANIPQVMQAWNSTGGTLEARNAPEMGASKSTLRIPNEGVFTVLEYSENSINLDGRNSRFVLVESNGEKGWILENYLNFN